MKLRLPSLLHAALLAGMICATTVYADTYLPQGVYISGTTFDSSQDRTVASLSSNTDRFYDGGKGSDWAYFSSNAYNIYKQNGNSTAIFGNLASSITVGSYYLGFNNLTNDSGHCWAYTSSNMLQHWQSYYGVFATKARTQNTNAPVHGYNYDVQYMEQLGGTQSLKLNKLFYDNWKNLGAYPMQAFGWYLAGENGWSYQNNNSVAGGYFKQYFPDYATSYTTTNIYDGANMRPIENISASMKSHFGFTEENGVWQQTTKGQIMYLELTKGTYPNNYSHAITCYGFETNSSGDITALYVVNSDDSKYQLVKVYVKLGSQGLELYANEDYSKTYNDWNVTGWSSINTPQVLKDMLAEYEKGKLTWMGNQETWVNPTAASGDPNVLPTDATGWMTYAGTGTNHAGYYNAHYTTGRTVEFNDAADSGTVKLGEDINVSAMEVNNSSLAYTFNGEGQTITTDSFTKTGSGSVTFSGVNVVAGTVTTTSEITFDELHVTGTLSAADNRIKANRLTLDGDATIGSLGNDSDNPTIGTTALTINGGTTTIRNWWAWTNLSSLELSDTAQLNASGASLCVSGNISSTADTLPASGSAGITTKYCLYVGTEGDASTGKVELAGNISAGAYIKILGDATVTGNVTTTKEYISIGGTANIGGNLDAGSGYISIGGDATVAGTLNAGGNLNAGGDITLSNGGSVGGSVTAEKSLAIGAGKKLTATGNITVKGDLTRSGSGERAGVETNGSLSVLGNVSNSNLAAQSITIGAEDSNDVVIDSVDMEVTGNKISLYNAEVRGNSHFSTTSTETLTLEVSGVTFVLDDSNSYTTQPFALFSADPLTQTETFYLSSSMLEGVNISGTITLDLSHWAYEIASQGYDNIELSFANDSTFANAENVQASFDGINYVNATEILNETAIFSVKTLVEAIPEPASTTLSLLALTALAARRRRR